MQSTKHLSFGCKTLHVRSSAKKTVQMSNTRAYVHTYEHIWGKGGSIASEALLSGGIGWLSWRRVHPKLMGVISQDPLGLQDNSDVTEEPRLGPGPPESRK